MTSKRFKLRSVNATLTTTLTFMIDEATNKSSKALQVAHKLSLEGWDINITDQTRGRCYVGHKMLSVPKWAWDKGPDYFDYYLSHELAHAIVPRDVNHGPVFMEAFKRICHPNNWHYELRYKPGYAAAAGIMQIPDDF